MLSSLVPKDFDHFWKETCEEALSCPLDYERIPQNTHQTEDHLIEILHFSGVSGEMLHGWIAFPAKSVILKSPAFLWIPPYSFSTMLPNQYGTRKNYVSLSFNFHGYNSFHQEPYSKEKGYFAQGIESPQTWIFRKMFQNAIIAMRILESLPEVDSERMASMGMSQGGGMSIWLGALMESVKVVCADMPFLAGMADTFSRKVYRYPLKEVADFIGESEERKSEVLNTFSYFDTLHLAARCQKPTLVALGFRDPACPPDKVQAIYRTLPAKKHLVEYNWGHDWHPDMVQDNLDWMDKFFNHMNPF